MKRANFPARKLARQIAAETRSTSAGTADGSLTARELYREESGKGGALDVARTKRSKRRAV